MPETIKVLTDSVGEIFLSFQIDAEAGLVYARWKGKVSLDDVKRGSLVFLELLEKVDVEKLISDNSELQTSWQTLNDWVETTWTPKAIEHGLRYFALVVSPIFFVKLSAVDLARRISDKIEFRTFTDVSAARRWLAEVHPSASQ